MKRNLSLTELTPLTPKETPSLKQRTLSVLLLYELAVITSSVLYLPSLSKDCPDINLYAWNFIFIILTVTHVLAFATENLCNSFSLCDQDKLFWAVHCFLLFCLVAWNSLGHYGAFVLGTECTHTESFIASTANIVIFDAAYTGIGVSLLVSSFLKRS